MYEIFRCQKLPVILQKYFTVFCKYEEPHSANAHDSLISVNCSHQCYYERTNKQTKGQIDKQTENNNW